MVELPEATPYKPLRNEKGQLLPGQSGNPNGKPPCASDKPRERITQEILDKLDGMNKPELIKLIKKVGGAMWGIGLMSDDEAFECVRLKLLTTGLTSESANSSLSVLKEWSDRTKGKPAQSIAMKIETDPLQKMSTDRLIRLEQEIARMTGNDAVIIPPMPQKLGDSF